MPVPMLQPARPIFSRDGSARSELYDDIYHASDGGPGQARHVFLAGNGLPGRWQRRARFTILENGFGTGLNFLATWAAWRADPDRPGRLHYLAVEKHPLSISDLGRVHRAWNEFQPLAEALRHAWPVATPGFHRLAFAGGRVVLTLMLGDAGHCLRHLRARVDAFFLDGFDPRKNPDMWSVELFRRCARLAAPDATLATWCVAGSVREALKEAGFVTEKRPGFARKREMLTGRLATPCAVPEVKQSARHAVIVGAGLAGCTMAERLTDRGWRVELLERYGAPAAEASGNLAGIVRPLLSRDDNLASRLSRACFLHTGRAWSAVDRAGRGPRRRLDGLLQVARDGEHEALQRQLASIYPEDYVRFVERDEAQRLLGGATAFGGWWFPGGGWGHPPGVCRSLLARGGVDGRLDFRFGADVARMEHREGAWRLFDAQGGVLAEAPTVILASGAHALRLGQTVGLPVTRVRGQVSHLPVGFLPALNHPVCREGYLTPALDGLHCLGASYAYDGETALREDEHAGNLRRLAHLLPGLEWGLRPADLGGRVAFRAATPDRLPLVGALPDAEAPLTADCRLAGMPRQPGLYGLLGLGSRGLVWSALAAEVLASQIEGEPMPLESDLVAAIDPARFRLRAHRRGHQP